MGSIRPHKVGLVLATLFGGIHFLWALLVARGWAQAYCKRRSKNVPLKRPDGPVVAVPKCTAVKSSEESGSKQDLRPEEARGGGIRWRCMSGFDGPVTSRG